jgi:CRP/FNR family transcriptional regulator, cyclic AMP receptor protein
MRVTLDVFRNETDIAAFSAGDVVFREGDAGDAMYVVLEGTVEVKANGEHVETLGPGEVLGEMALIDQGPRAATVVAQSACRLARIPEKRFLFMVRETPHFALQIMRVMAHRLRRMVARL